MINNTGIRMEYLSADAFVNNYGIRRRAFKVSERFLQSGKCLTDGEVLGWQIEIGKEKEYKNYLFTNREESITTEDFNWIFKDFAEIVPDKSIVSNDSFQEHQACYELLKAEDFNGNMISQGYKSLEEEVCCGDILKGEYFAEMCKEMSIVGARVRVTLSETASEHVPAVRVVFSFPEAISLTMRLLISLVFPFTMLKEEGAVLDEERMSDDQLQISIIKLLGFLGNNHSEFSHNRLFDIDDEGPMGVEEKNKAGQEETIEDLDLSVRSYNCLKRANINTIDQLRKMSDKELLNVRNLGLRGIAEIKKKLDEINELYKEIQLEGPSYTAMLDGLIGLDAVKEQVKKIAAFAKMQKDMLSQGKSPMSVALNMEFIGNPGTAKTTVARIMAGIFNEIGLLSSNGLVEVGRSDLVAEYAGQTAAKVNNVFEKAKGKILFIDEAYSLVDYWAHGFGDEAINTIVQEMENRRNETIVIFAGYPNEMEEFFSRNPD